MAQDRNEAARNAFAEQAARRSFAKAAAEGRAGVMDRFGHALAAGDLVLYFAPANGLVCRVHDAKPVLDPRAPVGTVQLVITTELPLHYPSGTRAGDIVKVGQRVEEKDVLTPPELGAAGTDSALVDVDTLPLEFFEEAQPGVDHLPTMMQEALKGAGEAAASPLDADTLTEDKDTSS